MQPSAPARRPFISVIKPWLLILGFVLLIAPQALAAVWFADSRVAASGNGTSWSEAKKTVAQALTAAATGDEIWVATGTYVESITLKSGVALYGGFAGTESQRDQRDPIAYPVLLTAAAGQLQTVLGNAVADVRLDGFTVKGGSQAGLRLVDVGTSATVANCVFRGNPMEGIRCYRSHPAIVDCFIHNNGDDGIYCYYGSPSIERCSIVANTTCGIFAEYGSPVVVDSCIVGNAAYGMNLTTACQVSLTNCLLAGNAGNALYVRGTSIATVVNCSFVSNTPAGSTMGSAIVTANSGRFTLRNSVFLNNTQTAVKEGCAGNNEVSNCLFRSNPNGDYFDFENYANIGGASDINSLITGASGNVDGDPLFPEAAAGTWTAAPVYDNTTCRTTFTDGNAGYEPGALVGLLINCDTAQRRCGIVTANTETTVEVAVGGATSYVQIGDTYAVTDFRLREDSACVDNGIATGAPATDIGGAARPAGVPYRGSDGTGAEYDIGIYEYQPDCGPKTLAMIGVEGVGTVTPAVGGVYAYGDWVQLQATTKRGCTFDRWVIRQHVDPPIAPVERTVEASSYYLWMVHDWDVWAYFTGTPVYLLDLSVQGPGTVVPVPLEGPYTEGTEVILEATAAGDARFDRWEGAITGTDNPGTVTMNADKAVTAVFVARHTLTASGYGGSVSPSVGIYDDGQVVSLTAVPRPGLQFSHWEGGASGTDNPTSITMNGDKIVTAVFVGDTPDLRVAFTEAPPPSRLKAGQILNVEWRVTNLGLAATDNPWVDRLYLSKDSLLDAGDKLLGEATSPGLLGPLSSYAQPLSIVVPVPDVAPGAYRLIVQTDADGAVFEMDETTAQTVSSSFTIVDCAMSAP